jgi:hypothetical protein
LVGIRWQALAIFLAGLFVAQVSAGSLTIKDLLEHGERYHQQAVSVSGRAAQLKILTGPRNLPFYTFTLSESEGAAAVTVIMQGKPEVANGDQVFVHGLFIKSRKAGRSTIFNRIEATIVERLQDQQEPLIG